MKIHFETKSDGVVCLFYADHINSTTARSHFHNVRCTCGNKKELLKGDNRSNMGGVRLQNFKQKEI